MKDYGVRWLEFDRNDRQVGKEKLFATEKQMQKFIAKLGSKDNFYTILSYTKPE